MFKFFSRAVQSFFVACLLVIAVILFFKFKDYLLLQRIIHNLKAESRIAEVLVTESSLDEYTRTYKTTIKFLEYDVQGRSMTPKYFTFNGNLIQFQTLVVRFSDPYVEQGHRLKGKSIYLFLKAFVLNGAKTQEFEITRPKEVPEGYRVSSHPGEFEKRIWERFWTYALDPKERSRIGVKNAQVEAPGSVFVPGTIYTLLIEHDGGIRIDTRPIPEIITKK